MPALSHPRPALEPGLPSRLKTSLVAALVGGLLLAGCGGGGSVSSADAAGGTPDASATAVAWTEGTLTGFGSIIVNGVRFDDSAATVTDDDGNRHAPGALRLGMRVAVDSSGVDSSSRSARASAVRFGSQVTGPVQAVDAAAGTLTVLGQAVDVTATTVFDDSLGGGLAAVAAGAVVEVHGLLDAATGRISATRIEPESSASAYKLRGVVSALDTGAKTFQIGAAVVSYASLASSAVPTTLANGSPLRVSLATTPVNGQWLAQSLGQRAERPASRAQAHLRGAITAFTSASSFSVDGTPVDASAASFPEGSASLALGVQVEVKGTLANGTLVASRVSLESSHRHDDDRLLELHGLITAIDTAAKTFVLRGVTVSYAGTVVYEDGTEANLVVGARVEVKGPVGSRRTELAATRIEFES